MTNKGIQNKELKTLKDLENAIKDIFQKSFCDRITKSNKDIKNFKQAMEDIIKKYNISHNRNANDPLFYHSCSECTFLGGFIEHKITETNVLNVIYYDLYAHKIENRLVLILRYGGNLDDYISFSLPSTNEIILYKTLFEKMPSINEALKRYTLKNTNAEI